MEEDHEIVQLVDAIAAALKTDATLKRFAVDAVMEAEVDFTKIKPELPRVLVYPYGESGDAGARNDSELSLTVIVGLAAVKPDGLTVAAEDAWSRARFADLRTVRRAVRKLDLEGWAIGETSSRPITDFAQLRAGYFYSRILVDAETDDVDD